MKATLIYFLFLLGLNNAFAVQEAGQAYYAIQNKTFPCNKILSIFKESKEIKLSFLWNTFGEDTSCIERVLNTNEDKPRSVFIHFSNECCRRNGTCKRGELLRSLGVNDLNKQLEKNNKKIIEAFVERTKKINVLIEKYPNVTFYLSTGLEDNYTKKAWEVVRKTIKKNTKAKYLFHNPLSRHCFMNRCEIHTKDLGLNNHWLFMPDGYCVKPFDSCNTNVLTQKENKARANNQLKNNNFYFLWWGESQGRYGESPVKAKNPRQRTIKITDKQVEQAKNFIENTTF